MGIQRHLILISRISFCICLLIITILALISVEKIPSFEVWDKINHFFAFVILTGLLYFSFVKVKWFNFIVLPLVCYGLILEALQGLTQYRFFSWFDLCADVVGILCGIVVCELISKYLAKAIPQ